MDRATAIQGLGRLTALAAFLALATAQSAAAQGIQITADRTEISLDEQVLLIVRVEGADGATPTLPELDGFRVTPAGQESQMSFLNGRASSSVSYRFLLTPRAKGVFEVGAATLEVGGTVYSSQPFNIRVVDQPQQSRDLFVTARVSTETPYVGQQVIYTWRFYRRVQVTDARLEPPSFEGFLMEELGDVREYTATVNGQQYVVNELRRALFPQEVGKLSIPSSELTVMAVVQSRRRRAGSLMDQFFSPRNTERRVLRGKTLEIDVRPLPPAPADFTGLVGSFELSAEMTRRELKVGESSTLKLTVRGEGNAQMISEPRLPDLARFKIYDDRPTSSIDRSGNVLRGSKSFTKALVPLQAGDLVIPEIQLSYFDPELESYRVATAAAVPLRVAPADGEEDLGLTESLAPTAGKVSVRIMADDILPIYKGLEAARLGTVSDRGWFLATALGLPPALYLMVLTRQRRRDRFAADSNLRRRQMASKVAAEKLLVLGSDNGDVAHLASRCLREFVGDKLGLEGSALTPAEVEGSLAAAGVEDGLTGDVAEVLRKLEAAQYANAPLVAAEAKAKLEGLIQRLERELKV